MSEQEYECGLCGMNLESPQAPEACGVCHGGADITLRAYTLTDHRTGQAPKEDRYGNDGGLNPKSSPLVVGGAVFHPGNRHPEN